MTPIEIRDAERGDRDRLVAFACAMAKETEGKRLALDTVARGIDAVFDDPRRGRYLVAIREGGIAGTLMLTYEWSDWRCADWWWIQSVYVDPAHRRRGVFDALYRHVLRECESAAPGCCGLRLYVERENHPAQRSYERLGMQRSHYHMYEYGLPWLREVIGRG